MAATPRTSCSDLGKVRYSFAASFFSAQNVVPVSPSEWLQVLKLALLDEGSSARIITSRCAASCASRSSQLATEGEDSLGVAEDAAAGSGELVVAAFPLEQLFAESGFQLTDLLGDLGLGGVKLLGGAGAAAFLGHGPEVT